MGFRGFGNNIRQRGNQLFALKFVKPILFLNEFGYPYQTFLDKFKGVPYKLVATATPSPNKYKELIHYAGFLEIMDTGQALTRFFQRDSTKANNLTLYPHKEDEFWLWVSSWALVITTPSDLGYDDESYALPPLEVRRHVVSDHYNDNLDRDGQYKIINDVTMSLSAAAREKNQFRGRRSSSTSSAPRQRTPSTGRSWPSGSSIIIFSRECGRSSENMGWAASKWPRSWPAA